MRILKTKPRVGALGPFYSQQFGLQAIAKEKIAWPLGTLGPEIYYEDIFEGIDYLALEGASGFSRLDGWIKTGATKFSISVRKNSGDNDWRRAYDIPLSDFAIVIELPASMAAQIIATDQTRGMNLKAMAQQAMEQSQPASR